MFRLHSGNIRGVESYYAHKPQSEKSYMIIFQIGSMPLRGCGWRNTHGRFYLS